MTRTEIFDKLKQVITTVKPKLDVSKIEEESELVKDLGVDSLSMLLLSLACEDAFSMRFESVNPFTTVKEVIDYIDKAIN